MSTALISPSNFKPAFAGVLMAGVRPENDMRRSVYLCSISPIAHEKRFPGSISYYLHADGLIHGCLETVFRMPPVPKGEYAVLQIFDSDQMITNTMAIANDNERPLMPAPQSAMGLANDMISEWTSTLGRDSSGDSSLGIGVIKGPVPSPDELSSLVRRQEVFFRRLVQLADDMSVKGETININKLHRKAAEWLGIDRQWNRGIVYTETKHCLNCGEQIKMKSRGCKECGTNLVNYALENDIPASELKETDPFIAAIVTSKRKSKAMKGKGQSTAPEVDDTSED